MSPNARRGASRRTFLKVASGLAAAGLAGCAGIPVLTKPAVDGRIDVDRNAFPSLGAPGGAVMVRPDNTDEPILLVALENGEYRALSAVCTHLGCTVRRSGPGMMCPCHGSTYALDGRVTRGPAPDNLTVYPTTVSGSSVVIHLNQDSHR